MNNKYEIITIAFLPTVNLIFQTAKKTDHVMKPQAAEPHLRTQLYRHWPTAPLRRDLLLPLCSCRFGFCPTKKERPATAVDDQGNCKRTFALSSSIGLLDESDSSLYYDLENTNSTTKNLTQYIPLSTTPLTSPPAPDNPHSPTTCNAYLHAQKHGSIPKTP